MELQFTKTEEITLIVFGIMFGVAVVLIMWDKIEKFFKWLKKK
jgi:hypothetical protein